MKILVAPNSFKECASSVELAEFISAELRKNNLSNVITSPVSDGGDDFLQVYKQTFLCEPLNFNIKTCYDDNKITIPAAFNIEKSTYVLESAQIIGLKTIPTSFRNPVILNSENFGMLLSELIGLYQAKKLVIGLGGTGTADLGLGLCKPFGLRLFDKYENELEIVPGNYSKVNKITLPEKTSLHVEIIIDVVVPLFGNKGSSFIFAGQKGASEEDIKLIEAGFRNIISVLKKDHGLDFTNKKIGAAGGLALGLFLISNLKITTSREFLKRSLRIVEKIKSSDLIITAEGRFDSQSLLNKATGIIIKEGLKRNKEVVLITGESLISFDQSANPPKVFELVKMFGSKEKALVQYKEGIAACIRMLSITE